ncbi:hydroxyisourate hydrolase [Dactylosporangium cerinum]|uniref:Hydroxyisourate hydrolase n=1 Tax=Dactylosporangium cerinum TaxID=1434730 RepID=A0ABV9WL77_9ACTN
MQALDGVYGRSAAGLRARIERIGENVWEPVASGETDIDGFITDWIGTTFETGAHRIVFDSDFYFAALGVTAAYPDVTVTIRNADRAENCRIQVVLAPSSYSMYFGTHG